MRRKKILFPAILFALCAPPALAAESVYTDFNTKKCRHIPGKEVEDYGEWHCK